MQKQLQVTRRFVTWIPLVLLVQVLVVFSVFSHFSENNLVIERSHSSELDSLPVACGHWMYDYAKRHREILALPKASQRLVIYDAYRNGLGDRLAQMGSMFLLAYLTDRAFVVKWPRQPARMEEVWNFPVIQNLTLDEETWAVQHAAANKIETLQFMSFSVGYDNEPINAFFGHENLHEKYADKQTLYVTSNQGQLWNLFENPWHREELAKRLDMHPQAAFGCIMRALLEPKDHVRALIPDAVRSSLGINTSLNAPPSLPVLRVGIQIRFGDDSFQSQNGHCQMGLQSARFQGFLACAKQAAAARSIPSQPIRYFLLTDCVPLRQAVQQLGPEWVSNSDAVVNHIENTKSTGFMTAVAEHDLFSQMDVHIITRNSAFGRTAALRSLKYHSIYTLDISADAANVRCGLRDVSKFEDLSLDWVRI